MYECEECRGIFKKEELLQENEQFFCPKCNSSLVTKMFVMRVPVITLKDAKEI